MFDNDCPIYTSAWFFAEPCFDKKEVIDDPICNASFKPHTMTK